MTSRTDQPPAWPLTWPPTRRLHVLAAILISLALVGTLAATLPLAREATRGAPLLVPAYAAAIFVLEAITAALLFALFYVQRFRPLLVLASGYLFAALVVPFWALSFPGAFEAFGLDVGLQATAAISALRRLGFALFLLAYALAPWRETTGRSAGLAVLGSVALVAAGAGLAMALILANRERLPVFMLDARNVADLWRYVPPASLGLYALGIGVLLWRRRTRLDVWVGLTLFSLAIETLLISYIGGASRLSVGWWAGRLYGLAAAGIVLLALLAQTMTVHARLARTLAAERRARQDRLVAMEALSASLAHEINQPLASMVTNADAARRWLARREPRLDKAQDALERIVADGHRANKVVTGIRTMFMKGAQERTRLDLNALAGEAVRAASAEARFERIPMELRLDPQLPAIDANGVQLYQVLCNLIENAIDAIRAAGDRPRLVTVATARGAHGEVELSVADSGTGIDPSVAPRIFEPFVSTKPGGMGMGLMFCRSIIEAHGGRLWATPNLPRGTVFHFSLPAIMLHAAEGVEP